MNKKKSELLDIFVTFFKIGAFTIGGGLAMIPIIEREVVENKKWLEQSEVEDVFAIVQSVPGVIAINSSIFIGYKRAGIKGALSAAVGVILPSFVIILIVASILFGIQDNLYMRKAFAGAKAGVTALLFYTVMKLSKSSLKSKTSISLAVAAFILITFFEIHAFFAILGGALLGFIIFAIRKVIKL